MTVAEYIWDRIASAGVRDVFLPEAYSSGRVIYERRKAEGFPPLE